MGLIDNWLFWMPGARLQGWLAYGAAIIVFWFLALRILRKMIGYAPPPGDCAPQVVCGAKFSARSSVPFLIAQGGGGWG